MKQVIPYRIIIVGGNHINTLSVIRCLGKCRCDIHVLIHSDQPLDKLNCANSKYSRGKTTVINKESSDILQWLLENKAKDKQIIIPCSDFAEIVIDENYEELQDSYYLPGFLNQPNVVSRLMDKWQQKLFADNYSIPMAKSWSLSNESDLISNKGTMNFPCIVKPQISAYGVKSDITICSNENELFNVTRALFNKNDKDLILQEYIEKTAEYDVQGFISNNLELSVINTIRKIYDINGNTVYAVFEENPIVTRINQNVVKTLHEMGYRGIFDIEYITTHDSAYLIEINFRHSGVGFGLIKNKVYLPYLWCLSICGYEDSISSLKRKVKAGRYLMDETVCFNHRREFGLSTIKWIGLCIKRCCFGKFDIHDIRGTVFLYKEIFRR